MDSNRLEGIGHQVKGVLKEGIGKIIGDAKLTADGAAERAAGEAQNVAGPEGASVIGIDTDRIAGVGHQLKGAVKEGLGNLAGKPELVAEGTAERDAGKQQNAVGGARDTAREAAEAAIAPTDAPTH
nr:CsbD family protein [uncultured Rhodopila sp.]